MAASVLLVILLITKFARGFLSNISVLAGIVIGCAAAFALGHMGFDKVAHARWFGLILPFQFGVPKFDLVAALTM